MSFKPNPGFLAEIRQEPRTLAALAAEARRARGFAQTFADQVHAPWMPRGGGASIAVEIAGTHVRLINTDHAGHLVEWGSRNNPPHALLRRGVRAAGIRLQEHGK